MMTQDHAILDMPIFAEEDGSRECSNKTTTSLPPLADSLKADIPPDGGYGWVCVACSFGINAHTWGINSSFGVFLAYFLSSNHYPGASPLNLAFIGGLAISQCLLVSPLATYTTRVHGTRTTLLIGTTLQTLGLIGASFSHQIWHLFLSEGVCFGYGMGFLFVGSVGIVPQWFTTRRSLTNGIATAGSGIGGLMYSLGTNAMIETIGVGWAFRILGILAFVINTVCALLVKDRNKAVGATQLAFDYSLFKRWEFLLCLAWGFFSLLGYVVLLFSLPDYALSIGLTYQQGSVINALFSLAQGLSRPVVGFYSDAVGRINIAGSLTFVCGLLSLTLWIFAKSYGVMIFFAIVVGTVAGIYWSAVAPVTAEVVALKDLPSALSLTWLMLVLPTTFSEAIAIKLRQDGGNIYLHTQVYTGLMYIAASLCILVLRAWKIAEIEEIAAQKGDGATETNQTYDINASSWSSLAVSRLARRLFKWKKV